MNRPDEQIQQLRPIIPLALIDNATECEAFQNAVIRPIIKLQHEIIISHIQFDRNFKTIKNNFTTKEALGKKLKDLFLNRIPLKNQLLGCIIGMLTVDELRRYHLSSSEYNKRIMAMINQRICDSFWGVSFEQSEISSQLSAMSSQKA